MLHDIHQTYDDQILQQLSVLLAPYLHLRSCSFDFPVRQEMRSLRKVDAYRPKGQEVQFPRIFR